MLGLVVVSWFGRRLEQPESEERAMQVRNELVAPDGVGAEGRYF